MSIQTEKLELVRLILDTDNPSILSAIREIFASLNKKDFWDTLPESQKEEILQGIEEIEQGETVSYEENIRNHRS